eukprot:CAMPEP_0172583834 /NCGR_PEP_ID=MMETSP1068-20121228/3377_1 /TAXON_ID=35684 /ORGANISM="Pseudopedinella elastica, Strain CCMP716" /LENGTH=119 /DNA_ID=CAMNT_0013377763 /DNA_START=521 /DNA_END=880 /DNA_ORIENTATION=-
MLGGPCLFRKKLPYGKVFLAFTYVYDFTFAVSDDASHEYFMSVLRSRSEIDESEGMPIDFLLGMDIEQNLKAGIVHMGMEMAIVKVARGILTPEELVKNVDVNGSAAAFEGQGSTNYYF